MRISGTKLVIALVVLAGVSGASVPMASAADKSVQLRPRDGTYVKMRHVRRHLGCSDAYSCYPLYGAYGPYGGRAFWASYSDFIPPEYR